jgi:hypothetical protein
MAQPITGAYLRAAAAKAALLICLVELTLRLLPASDGPYTTFDPRFALLKYDSRKQTDGYQTAGNLAQRRTRWHVNRQGWNSPYDYPPEARKPVLALVGNSYVEGMTQDLGQGLEGLLQRRLGDRYNCYSFGFSSARLSQDLNIARYVHQVFHPRILVLALFDTDVLSSVAAPGAPAQHTLAFRYAPGQVQEAPIRPFVPRWGIRVFEKLALVRYFAVNKQQPFAGDPVPAPDRPMQAEEQQAYTDILDYTFRRLRDEHPGTTVMLVLDAPRREIYAGTIQPRTLQARALIRAVAGRYGLQVVDLYGPMAARYRANGVKFNSDTDYHWNSCGFRVVADAVAEAVDRLQEP